MKGKHKAQKIHSRRRAMERYGINPSRALHDEWVRRIQSGDFKQARPLEKQSVRLTVFQLEHDGEVVRVVYDKTRKQIVTVLPKDDPRWGGPVRSDSAIEGKV